MLESGQSFGHFKIIKKLGEGGMGEVYLAEDTKLNRKIALKILQPAFLDDADRMQRLIREARTAAQISHPNVMGIYDLDSAKDEDSGRDLTYIVMEYVGGQSLTDYLQMRKPNIAECLRIAEKIASGLAAAHKLNIVHRDIKTDNIRIDEDGTPKILDFGLAKPLDATFSGDNDDITDSLSNDLTQEGKIMGTVTYMSPEQARGETVDSRSDIFSFGILMYRMFTGDFPFDGQEKVSILAKILESKQLPMRERNESLPPELERIVDKCLQKNPNDRYQDTRDLVIDIRSLRRQFESSISDSNSIITGVSGKKGKSYVFNLKRPIRIAIVLIAILIPMYIIFNSHDDKPTTELRGLQAKENAMAILGFQNKTGDAEMDWLQSGLPEILLTDLAQNGAINIISRNRVLDCLGEKIDGVNETDIHKDCIKAAKSLGAATVLSGSFYKMGEKIRIDARLEDVESGRIILGEKVVGDDPFALVDSLTQKIAQSLNVQGALANNRGVAEFTSSSPEAYRYYIQGMEKFSGS
ncbi:MAG: serine/threonine-protein kinase, partial [Candidatus Zixiibacteriota bacterium]